MPDQSYLLPASQKPSPGNWVARGDIADSAVRRVWLRSFENYQTTAAGLATVTSSRVSTWNTPFSIAAARFTRSADSVVMEVAAEDIIAVSST